MDEFSGLFLHPLIFSIKHSRFEWIINGALLGFWYSLNSNILLQYYKNLLFLYTFLWDSTLFAVAKE